jgi:hypothetical protein
MIAKNVGIRRARGEFVLATNPDLLFSNALFAFLASAALRADCMYRIDRHDVPALPPLTGSTDDLLAWCETNILRVHTRWGTFPPLNRSSLLRPGLSFDLLWIKGRSILTRLRRHAMALLLKQLALARQVGLRGTIMAGGRAARRFIHLGHLIFANGGTRAFRRCRLALLPLRLIQGALRLALQYLSPLPKIHTNGCGDFTLLSRDAWFNLRAYPELPIWSMHIDSLLCYMAVAYGISEALLKAPKRLFHLEHGNSWVVLSPDDRLRTFAKMPWLDVGLVTQLWNQMYRTGEPVRFNTETWGLADCCLHEVWIQGGEKKMIKNTPAELAATGS